MENIVENNAYRILGLSNLATKNKIRKRSKEIIRYLEIDKEPKYDTDWGNINKIRTIQKVRKSKELLFKPKNKIKQFFFGFSAEKNIDCEALWSLNEDNYEKAIITYQNQFPDLKNLNEDIFYYKRNLAILYLYLLLYRGVKKRNFLEEPLTLWKKIVDSSQFWFSFIKMYNSNDYLNTNERIIKNFRKKVKKYLGDIYVDLYKIHNNKNYILKYNEIFSANNIMSNNSFLNPIFNKIVITAKKLESMGISDDGKFDDNEKKQLHELVDKLNKNLNQLKKFGLGSVGKVKNIRDRAAIAIKRTALDLHNNLRELDKSVSLLKEAKKIAGTKALNNDISNQLKIAKENYKYHGITNRCWFCKKDIDNQKYVFTVNMYKIVKRKRTFAGVKTRYKRIKVSVPRCEDCKNYHKRIINFRVFGIVLGFILSFILAGMLGASLVGFIFLSLITVIITCRIARYFADSKARDNQEDSRIYKKFPILKKMLDEGWKIGDGPKR